MYKTENFVPLKTKTNIELKENKISFLPKSTNDPLKSVYKQVEKTQYSRVVYTEKRKK